MDTALPSHDNAAHIRVGMCELRSKLTQYLREASQGTSFLVTSHNDVIAEIRPPSPRRRTPRQPGALRGQIIMSDDFNTWPADILDTFEA